GGAGTSAPRSAELPPPTLRWTGSPQATTRSRRYAIGQRAVLRGRRMLSTMSLPESAYRTVLGRPVSRVGFGGYRVDDRTPLHRQALVRALDEGVNVVDTSTNYGDGRS